MLWQRFVMLTEMTGISEFQRCYGLIEPLVRSWQVRHPLDWCMDKKQSCLWSILCLVSEYLILRRWRIQLWWTIGWYKYWCWKKIGSCPDFSRKYKRLGRRLGIIDILRRSTFKWEILCSSMTVSSWNSQGSLEHIGKVLMRFSRLLMVAQFS